MAESPEDTRVDELIDRVQTALNDLKAAQAKDVKDEDSEYQGKNLKEAGDEAYIRVRAHNRRARSQDAGTTSGKPNWDDRLK